MRSLRLVGHGAEVIAQPQVQGEPLVDFPVILNVGREVLEVELARISHCSPPR